MKYALGLEYDGTSFNGYQAQPDPKLRTVQRCLDKALSTIANHPIISTCAGRTDAGVHASEQVVHFETDAVRPEHGWVFGLNRYLPPDISVQWIKPVPDDFHARFKATRRRYRYVVSNTPTRRATRHRMATWHLKPLDAQRMDLAVQTLLGEHDFTVFRAAGCQAKNAVRTVYEAFVERQGDFVILEIEANAFLYHMVRNIMGSLLVIGAGEQPQNWLKTLLAGKDRTQAGMLAPAQGLSLIAIRYPDLYNIPMNHQPRIIHELV